ncbi:hypothetical protein D1007_43273 [Hordeum vulgare]|nr:hypothetical protein D1007_43273 [Hordeum vulgare]
MARLRCPVDFSHGHGLGSAQRQTAATRIAAGVVAEAEAARNETPPVSQLRTQAEQMTFLVSSIQHMVMNIQDMLQNQKSIERVVETKFHDMGVNVTELTTVVKQLQHEVDSVEIPHSDDDDEDDDGE